MATDISSRDSVLLSSIPEHVQCSLLCKARPVEDGGLRMIYVEASNEGRDFDGEVVLGKALRDSREIFLKFGVVDLDHKSMPSVARQHGITAPEEWIIGQPTEVRFDRGVTFVKAQLRQGDSPLAERANRVWDGLTKLTPPDRYYASVGGKVVASEIRLDPVSGDKVPVITRTHWNNLALSLNPVNPGLAPASRVPAAVFAKSLEAGLTAGYGTDSAGLVGGGALRMQSLHGVTYPDFRNALAEMIRRGEVRVRDPGALARASLSLGVAPEQSGAYVERFLSDLTSSRRQA